ncbi:HAMP domain-containing sensor histidine kinase [Bacillus sp. CECT 9360]|uniref:sensor histidine kinase n=1 Tax=Bacillus sp. CECT 9360 TaxID=2845821 RepID=UPI001E49BE71|nr:HAMP domain-containing sensor histidine kinase [Bacillus sp. CECT 9360]CAH0345891.1 Adaptive-response sensory-kinase SasA [Bacillus sp. CECT 9360]
MLNLENVFLHLLIIILPVFLYHGIIGKMNYFPNNKRNQFHRFLLLAISAILSMVFPIAGINGISYDFRSLVIIFAFFYCGKNYAFLLILLTSLFRIFIGGKGLMASFVLIPFIYALPLIFSYFWSRFSKKQKYMYALLAATVSIVMFYFSLLIFNVDETNNFLYTDDFFQALIVGWLCYAVILLTIVFYEEYMEENALLRIQIINSEKMNVVSELAASVAHEIRNPLTVVRGFIQLMKDDKSAMNKEYMQLVLTELARAETIIADYLDLARQNSVKREIFQVSSLIKDVMNVMKSYSNMNGVDLSYYIHHDYKLIGDLGKLKQVFYNLIKNSVESINHTNGRVMINVTKHDGKALIAITDNGIGMDQQQLERIGEPFFTLKDTGTGLGVMVTKSIIESHHGGIEYESEPGKGTEIFMTLPLHKEETD